MIFIELLQYFGGADGARTRARLAPARVIRDIPLPSPTLPGGRWGRAFFGIIAKNGWRQ